MKTDLLADRHIGIQEADLPAMLEKIGVKSLDELINKTIPSKIRLKEPLALEAPMTEREFAEHITGLASLNKIYTSYIGMACEESGMVHLLHSLSNRSLARTSRSITQLPDRNFRPHGDASCQLLFVG